MRLRLATFAFVAAAAVAAVITVGCPAKGKLPVGDQIQWSTSFSETQAAAKAAHKPMAVDFCATWCGPCRMLAEMSFPSSKVQALKDRFVWARIDVDLNHDLAQKYQISSLPTVMVMDSDGKTFTKLVGFTDGDSLAGYLADALTKSRLVAPGTPAH
jgi:thioredoxin 1